MLKLRNSTNAVIFKGTCSGLDFNCIFCDGQAWDINI